MNISVAPHIADRSIIKTMSVMMVLLLTLTFAADSYGQRKGKSKFKLKTAKTKFKGDESPYPKKAQPDECKQFKTFEDCPRIGCGGSPTEYLLNQRKNIDRPDLSSAKLMDFEKLRNMKMPAGYQYGGSRKPLTDAGEGDIVTIVADMTAIRTGSQESCNCYLSLAKDTDNHMVLINQKVINQSAKTGKPFEKHSVTAEFSPRGKVGKTDFRVSVIDKLIRNDPRKRLKVRLTGSLMFDEYHEKHPLPKGRQTNWELHPVWEFEYCPTNKCTLTSDTGWIRIK